MNSRLIFLNVILLGIFVLGCEEREPFVPPISGDPENEFRENYRFYPLSEQFEWRYDHFDINPFPIDTVIRRNLIATYNERAQQMTTMFGTDTFSYNWFGNFRNKLTSGSFVALDYSLLEDCKGDSVLVYSDTLNNGTIRNRFQHCGFQFPKVPSNKYQNVPCLKSVLYNYRIDGSIFIGEYYYGRDIGLIERTDQLVNSMGVTLFKRSYYLTSTNF